MIIKSLRPFKLAFLLLPVYCSLFCWAQQKVGTVQVSIVTNDGIPLPGAEVTLTSDAFSQSTFSDEAGLARFAGLSPGLYEIRIEFVGFRTVVRPNIHVDTGESLQLRIFLQVSSDKEQWASCVIPIYTESEKFKVGAILKDEELSLLPQVRDPWAVLDTIPGIQTDRVNIGGNESGQQAFFVSKGDDGTNSAWMIDGIDISDPSAEGTSLAYLGFDAFDEIEFLTGGSHVSSGASGTIVNFSTKNGTNEHHGSMRLLFADQNFQSNNLKDGQTGNRIVETFAKGFEIGGPIVKDRFWYWGSINQNTIENRLIDGSNDKTRLENISFKLHGDLSNATRVTALYMNSDKQKEGIGAGLTRAPETTWNQNGPTPFYRFEISHLIGSSTELQLIYGRVDGGFQQSPQVSPDDAQPVFDGANNRWENSYRDLDFRRSSRQYEFKGNTYLAIGSVEHDFNYGFQYKNAWAISKETWGQNGTNLWVSDYSGLGSTSYFFAHRDRLAETELDSTSLWLNDTMMIGNLTMLFGLRYNISDSSNSPSSVEANPLFPEAVPALVNQGDDPQFEYKTLSPQIGAAYTFGGDEQFLVRGSYRKYYDNISVNEAASINAAGRAWIRGFAQDYDGNGQYDSTELGFARDENGNVIPYRGNEPHQDPYFFFPVGFNPNGPPVTTGRDRIDPNLEPPEVDEFILGGEWALSPSFSIDATYTYRKRSNFQWNRTSLGNGRFLSRDDYELSHTLTGTNPETNQTYSVDFYTLSEEASILQRSFGGSYLTNRPDYSQDYQSLELTATKRLSRKWMMRGFIAFQDWTWNVGQASILNPTPNSTRTNVDGAPVALASGGSGDKANVFPGTASWTASLTGLYQLPWDMAISGVFSAREGYLAPLFNSSRGFLDGIGSPDNTSYSIGDLDSLRYDDLYNLNLKLSKTLLIGNTHVDLAVEIFNVFNENTVLQLDRRVGIHTNNGNRVQNFDDPNIGTPLNSYRRVEEYLSPRIARFSATINF